MNTINRLILLFICLIYVKAGAQDVKFIANASKNKVAVGEQFQITFTAGGNANLSSFKAPSLADFTILMGPSQSTSVQIINGNFSQEISISYVIAANKEGIFIITPASMIINGKRSESNSIKIEVTKNPVNENKSDSPNNQNAFVKTIISKSKVYIGEQFTATHKIYSRDQILGFKNIDFPSYEGFWSQVLDNKKQNIQLSIEVIDGTEYYVAELRQVVLFPQKAGKLDILPLNVEMIVKQASNKKPTNIFEQFFGTSYKEVQLNINGTPTKVEVTGLPENNKPNNFKNYLGNFSCSTVLDKEKVKTNDAVNLKITISGKGNLKMVDAPILKLPPDLESFEPKTSEKISITAQGMSGNKTFEYIIIPRVAGNHKIEIEPFSFYDSDKKQYITIPSPEYTISVERSSEEEKTTIVNSNTQTEIQPINTDIHYIKTSIETINKNGEHFYGSWLFYSLASLPPILLFLLVFANKQIKSKNQNIALLKKNRAVSIAKKHLKIAEKNISNRAVFYEEVSKALYGYFSDTFNIPISEISIEKIELTLKEKGISHNLANEFTKLINECQFARYAPSVNSDNLTEFYSLALNTIVKIEGEKQ